MRVEQIRHEALADRSRLHVRLDDLDASDSNGLDGQVDQERGSKQRDYAQYRLELGELADEQHRDEYDGSVGKQRCHGDLHTVEDTESERLRHHKRRRRSGRKSTSESEDAARGE